MYGSRVLLKCTDMIEFGTPNTSKLIVKHIRTWALWCGDQPSKRALVIVNPKSGNGKYLIKFIFFKYSKYKFVFYLKIGQ